MLDVFEEHNQVKDLRNGAGLSCVSAAAMLLQLWLLALGSYMQLCIYHSRQMRHGDGQADDAGCVWAGLVLHCLLVFARAWDARLLLLLPLCGKGD
jgi:hypothetical protein